MESDDDDDSPHLHELVIFRCSFHTQILLTCQTLLAGFNAIYLLFGVGEGLTFPARLYASLENITAAVL